MSHKRSRPFSRTASFPVSATNSSDCSSEMVSAAVAANARSDESAEPGDRLADDQVLHLVGALVGVERLGVGEEAGGLVVGDDAVAAEHLARKCDGLAALRRAERLVERRMSVRQFAFVIQL